MTQNRTVPLADKLDFIATLGGKIVSLTHGHLDRRVELEKAAALLRQQQAALADTVEVVRRLAIQYEIDDSFIDVALAPARAAIKAAEDQS